MTGVRRGVDWLRGQWNNGGTAKRIAIIGALLLFWPFLLVGLLIAAVYEIVAALDKAERFPSNARWGIAIVIVVGGMFVLSAISPRDGADGTGIGGRSSPPPVALASPSPADATDTPTLQPPSEPTESPAPAATPGATEAPTRQVEDQWTLPGWQERFAAYGFTELADSPLLDGTPRKLLRRPSDNASSEAIGDPTNLDRVSLMIGATGDTGAELGELLAAFLNTYAPGTRDDLVANLGPDTEFTIPFADGEVSVQTLSVADGALVVVTVDRD